MATFLDESFEAPGYENAWNETKGAGNTIDDANAISGTPPSGAGSLSLKTILAGTNPDAYATFDVGSDKLINYIRCYMYIDASGTGQFDTLNIISLKGSVNNLNIQYRYTPSNGHHLTYQYYNSGVQTAGTRTHLNLDQWYLIEAQYDATNNTWEFRLDESTEFSGILTNARDDSQLFIVGPVGNKSDGLTIEFDLIKWVDDGWIGPESGVITVNETVSDGVIISDSNTPLSIVNETLSDGIKISDGNIPLLIVNEVLLDGVVLSDQPNNSIIITEILEDGIVISDVTTEGGVTAVGILSGTITSKTGDGDITSKVGSVLFGGKKSKGTFSGSG